MILKICGKGTAFSAIFSNFAAKFCETDEEIDSLNSDITPI